MRRKGESWLLRALVCEVLKPVKCSTDEMHRNPKRSINKFHELGAQHGIPSTWRETPPRMATSTKQKAQRQCYSQREGQTGQKIEYSVDCLVSHSCMLYPITEFFWQSDYFLGKEIFSRALHAQLGGSSADSDMIAQKFPDCPVAEL